MASEQLDRLSDLTSAGWLTQRELARRAGVTVRRVYDWHAKNLIRGCVRIPISGKQGPGVHLCPPDSLGAARTLARCGSHVPNVAAARFWLWMEGYERIAISPDRLSEASSTMLVEMQRWRDSLGDDDELADRIDRDIIQPMLEHNESRLSANVVRAIVTAFLTGETDTWLDLPTLMEPGNHTEPGDKRLSRPNPRRSSPDSDPDLHNDPFQSSAVHALLRSDGSTVAIPEEISQSAPLAVTDMLASISLDSIRQATVNWDALRLLWQALCLIADTPGHTQPAQLLHQTCKQLRRSLYTIQLPHTVLLMAATSSLLERLARTDVGHAAAADLHSALDQLPGGDVESKLSMLMNQIEQLAQSADSDTLEQLLPLLARVRVAISTAVSPQPAAQSPA